MKRHELLDVAASQAVADMIAESTLAPLVYLIGGLATSHQPDHLLDRHPRATNGGPQLGQPIEVRRPQGKRTGTYRTAIDRNVRGGIRISRADVADSILRCLADPGLIHAAVSVAN